ncbi:AGC family protein kinase [Trichomonas vaginalis G3]|uniref:non-specific serine/threonine protein kinase n=1 Tax=Trichomonas vaginalis (strain ATCC PRA-98 / G3) TaxID=412133 RepID=A2DCS5_TRIV3|nr:protein serine/threonine kinase protein [Trichomonas vaginalis G3]EAY21699.1 AGC family protein kinase [Trichomonas vaginalis G3]KAI5524321.1 protein serine/threonine kinase protein [Trichomonas vaginalis G3]|eukprot:XP_001582685.1 AGC family protein kinase [Trichomonas vaginalis G3]
MEASVKFTVQFIRLLALIKKIPKIIDNNDRHLILIKREIEIMKKIPYPFITDFYEVLENEDSIFIVMEYVSNGTIRNTLNESGPFSEESASIIFAQIILVLKHLQFTCNVAHRDLKTDNILFDAKGNIRVIDFGLSSTKSQTEFLRTQCGTPSYASPEMILGERYGYSCDIWSSGIVLYEMVTGHLPFEDANLSKLAQKIVFQEVEYPNNLSLGLVDLLSKLLTKDQTKRITLPEIMRHPWLKDNIKYVEEKLNSFRIDKNQIKSKLISLGLSDSESNEDHESVAYHVLKCEYQLSNFDSLNVESGCMSQRQMPLQKISILPKLCVLGNHMILRGSTSRNKTKLALICTGKRRPTQAQLIQL